MILERLLKPLEKVFTYKPVHTLRSRRSLLSEYSEHKIREKDILSELESLFAFLLSKRSMLAFSSDRDKEKNAKSISNSCTSQDILKREFGFSLRKSKSTISDSGFGVFLDGKVNAYKVVALYPGTIFLPGDPCLFPSISNDFFLRCSDGSYIDGKPYGLSKIIYLSCASRETFSPQALCDTSWVDMDSSRRTINFEFLRNPLSVGHYINHYFDNTLPCQKNQPSTCSPNVMLFEFAFPSDFPIEFRNFIPHVHYRQCSTYSGEFAPIRSVALISLRNLHDEELLSDYCFIGYQRASNVYS